MYVFINATVGSVIEDVPKLQNIIITYMHFYFATN